MHAGAIIASGGLSDALPGSSGACPASLWVLSPVQALLEVLAHTALMVVAFDLVRRAASASSALAPSALADPISAVALDAASGATTDEPSLPARAAAAAPPGDTRGSLCACGCSSGWVGVLCVHLLWSLPSLASSGMRDACLWAAGAQLLATVAACAWAGLVVTSSDYHPAQRAGRAEVLAAAERARRIRDAQADLQRQLAEEERRGRLREAAAAETAEGGGVRHR